MSGSSRGGVSPSASSAVGAVARGDRRLAPTTGGLPPRPTPWVIQQPLTRTDFDRAVREYIRREADVSVLIRIKLSVSASAEVVSTYTLLPVACCFRVGCFRVGSNLGCST